MIFNFATNVKKDGRTMITLPSDLCKKFKIKLKDILFIKIRNYEFFGYVVGTNSSKRVTLPSRLLNKLPKGKLNVQAEILQERKSKLKINDGILDLYYSLPNKIKHYEWPLAIKDINDKIIIWSPTAYSQTIPRYLKLNEKLFEVFGLIQGEGYKKSPIGGTRFEFVNSENNIINYILNYFEENFTIPINSWSTFVNYVYNENKTRKSEEEIIGFWNNNTKIPKSNFKRINYLEGKAIRSSEFGVLHILIPSCVLGEICLSMLDISEKLAVKNEEYAAAFLRGLLAADGSATVQQYKNYKTLRIVELAVETNHEIELYSKVMNKLKLNIKDYSKSSRKLCVSSWNDFLKLAKIDAFKLHKRKKETFKKGFINHKQTRMIKKYLNPLINKELSIKETQEKLNLKSKGSLAQTFNVQIKRGLIKRIKRGREYKYHLTKKGRKILKFLENY